MNFEIIYNATMHMLIITYNFYLHCIGKFSLAYCFVYFKNITCTSFLLIFGHCW